MKDDQSKTKTILTKPYNKKKNKQKPLELLKRIVLFVFVLAVISAIAVTGYVLSVIKDMPEIEETKLLNYAISSEIYDKNDILVASLHGVENRMPVSLEDISTEAVQTILSVEDKRFYKHPGVDLYRIGGAVIANIKDGFGAQGGSTITQQLVKISFFDPKDISLKRKIQEAFVSLKLERTYSKDEILEMYLNKIYFGRGAYGVEAAAKTFFNTRASELTYAQSAVLAGVIQNPWANSPINHPVNSGNRFKTVLLLLEKNDVISKEERESIIANFEENGFELDLSFTDTQGIGKYTSFIDNAFEEALEVLDLKDQEAMIYSGGYKIYTTMDTKIQNKMEEVYSDDTKFPKGKGDTIIQSAMVVIDPHSGEIRGLIGGRNLDTARGFNRATQALRQPGSSFKPIAVFGPALEMGYSPASVFEDYPKAFLNYVDKEESEIVFKNIDNRSRGLISMRRVLTESINVCSVRALEQIGIDNGFMFAQDLGISSLVGTGEVNDKGYALALGGLTYGVSPLELTAAYSAFANGGIKAETHSIRKIEDYYGEPLYEHEAKENAVMSPQTAYLMTSMLQSAVAEGTGVKANFGNWPIAGKTGTTSYNADVWFVGYTPELIGGIWMGYDKEETMSYVYGGTHAAPVWKAVMEVAHEDLPISNFIQPEGIVSVAIDIKSGLLPSNLTPAEFIKTELFNEENVPTEISNAWISIPNCPPGVFLVREEPWQTTGFDVIPEDAYLEPPDYCNPFFTGGNGTSIPDSDLPGFRISGQEIYQGDSSVLQGFKITWTWNRQKEEGLVFDIHRSDTPDFIPSPSTRIANASGNEFIDSTVSIEKSYYYKIIAYNNITSTRLGLSNTIVFPSTNNISSSDRETVNKEISAPQLSISPKKSGDQYIIQLKWSMPNGNGGYEFLVYRGSEPGFRISSENLLNISQKLTDLSYRDSQIKKGNTYYYKVVAYNTENNLYSTPSNELKVGIPVE